MDWTKDKPTESGFYWFKFNDDGKETVVEVNVEGKDVFRTGSDAWYSVDGWTEYGFWGSRVKTPQEEANANPVE
jgi:hypothetical protein